MRRICVFTLSSLLGLRWIFIFCFFIAEGRPNNTETSFKHVFELSDNHDRRILVASENSLSHSGSNEEIASTEQKFDIEIEIEQINEIVEIPSVTNAPYFDPLHLVNVAQWNREYSDVAEDECQMEDNHAVMLEKINVWGGSARTVPRIFCGVYTHSENHQTKMKSIMETWGSRCDGFVGFSNSTDPSVATMGLDHEGEESWDNLWQKTRSVLKYIHTWYRTKYDWFLLSRDDSFIIVENLRKYLKSMDFNEWDYVPYYLGMRFQYPDETIFNSGGAAYVLNVIALEFLMTVIDTPECKNHPVFAFPPEDLQLSICLSAVGISAHDTRDGLGGERFHPFNPEMHLDYRVADPDMEWYDEYAFDAKEGLECCNEYSISWHYVDPELMRRIFNLVYTCKLS